MTECNGCGGCCMVVDLPGPIYEMATINVADPTWLSFLLQLEPLTEAEARVRAPWMFGRRKTFATMEVAGRRVTAQGRYFYRCPRLDEATMRCTEYEARPDYCRGYPWYDAKPDPGAALPHECSFRADIGQPVTIRTGARP